MRSAKFMQKAAEYERVFGTRQSGFKLPASSASGPSPDSAPKKVFKAVRGKAVYFSVNPSSGAVRVKVK